MNKKVLIVDDEKDIADILSLLLTNFGYEPVAVYSAKDAIESLKKFEPFLVISDINMPQMNGIELADYINEHFSASIILATGFEGYEEKVLQNRGVLKLLKKPFDFSSLEEIINEVEKCSSL